MDLRTDPKQVAATKLIDLQNAVFTRQTTLSKRNGYEALSRQIQNAGGDIADARGLAQRDDEILLFTDKRCYSQRPSSDSWSDTGEVAATTVTTLPIARTGTYQTQPDTAVRNGIRVVAWEDSRGGVWYEVIEATTGRILVTQTQIDASSNAKNPRCLAVSEVLHLLWTRADLQQIQIAVVNPANPIATLTVAILTADLDPSQPFFDAEAAVNAPSGAFALRPGLIAWAQAGGGFRIGYIAQDGTLGSPLSGLPSVATYADILSGPIAVAWDPRTARVGIAWVETGGSEVHVRIVTGLDLTILVRDQDSLGLGAGAYIRIAAAFGSVGTDALPLLYWTAEVTAARTDLTQINTGSVGQTFSFSGTTVLFGHGLVSRAFADGVDVYVMIAHTVRFFPYVACLRLSTTGESIAAPFTTVVARLMPGECAGSLMRTTGPGTLAWTQHLPSVTQDELGNADLYTRKHSVVLPYRIQLSSQNGDQFSEQGLKIAALNFSVGYRTAQLGRGLYLASAAPMHYDGDAWHEADFNSAPDLGFDATGAPVALSTAITIDGAGALANGTYLYAIWYEAVDAQGELHRGAVSAKQLVTMAGGPLSFSLALPTCRLTRFGNVRICVARSAQGATGTDSSIELFKVTSNDVTVTTGANRYVNNSTFVDTVTFVDALSDTELVKREPLYTNGGVLSNDPAPWGGGILAASKSRLFWNDSTNPNLVRYSQQLDADTALEAPVALSLQVDAFGGPITAIGALDDTIVPFTETATYVFAGPGPLADPSIDPGVNVFTSVELVTSDVGCISPASIGQTPLGITFQSRKGIKLLSRQRQVIDIGNEVGTLDEQVYTRTTLLPDRKSIIYLTNTPDGFSLLWDYDRNQWSKFSNHLGLDAIVVGGVYHYLRTDGRVFRETPGVYRDDNSRIPLRIETAWIHFYQHLQGWQKILHAYFLGAWISPHTFSLRYRIDYNDGYSPAILVNVNSVYDPSLYGEGLYGAGAYGGPNLGGGRYQQAIHLNRRCQSMSFLIEDVEAPGDFGASFELSEMLLIGGGLGAAFKVGPARMA